MDETLLSLLAVVMFFSAMGLGVIYLAIRSILEIVNRIDRIIMKEPMSEKERDYFP